MTDAQAKNICLLRSPRASWKMVKKHVKITAMIPISISVLFNNAGRREIGDAIIANWIRASIAFRIIICMFPFLIVSRPYLSNVNKWLVYIREGKRNASTSARFSLKLIIIKNKLKKKDIASSFAWISHKIPQ